MKRNNISLDILIFCRLQQIQKTTGGTASTSVEILKNSQITSIKQIHKIKSTEKSNNPTMRYIQLISQIEVCLVIYDSDDTIHSN